MTVYTAECPKLLDGRAQHYFVSVVVQINGQTSRQFQCTNCGKLSNPRKRWEERSWS